MKFASQHTLLWGLALLLVIALIVRSRRAEGLKKKNKKPVTVNKTQKRDKAITGTFPPNVKSVLKKPDGDYVVIKVNGKKVRYPDPMIPSFLRDQLQKNKDKPEHKNKSTNRNKPKHANTSKNRKDRKRKEREDSITGTAIAKLERQLEKIQDGIEQLQDDARERHMMERVRDLIDKKLRTIRKNGRIPGVLPLPKDPSEGYVDRGDIWALA
jgi:hypothetical protein